MIDLQVDVLDGEGKKEKRSKFLSCPFILTSRLSNWFERAEGEGEDRDSTFPNSFQG